MHSSLLTLLVAAAAAPAVLAQDDAPPGDYRTRFADGLGSEMDPGRNGNGGLNGIATTPFHIKRWKWGQIPKQCYENSKDNGYCDPYDVEVYDVTYNDCADAPVVFCRCNKAEMGIESAVDYYGKLPPRARQWNRYVNIQPASFCSAYSTTLDLTFLGDCSHNGASVFVHELSHNLDRWVGGGGDSYSDTDEWQDIIRSDTCVADPYSKSSWAEAYAQIGVLSFYDAAVEPIADLGVDCLANQLEKVTSQLGEVWRSAGQTCNMVWERDPNWCMGDAARKKKLCRGTPEQPDRRLVETRNPNVTVRPVPELPAKVKAVFEDRIHEVNQKLGYENKKLRRNVEVRPVPELPAKVKAVFEDRIHKVNHDLGYEKRAAAPEKRSEANKRNVRRNLEQKRGGIHDKIVKLGGGPIIG